jgi:hypothetical protein
MGPTPPPIAIRRLRPQLLIPAFVSFAREREGSRDWYSEWRPPDGERVRDPEEACFFPYLLCSSPPATATTISIRFLPIISPLYMLPTITIHAVAGLSIIIPS